MSYFHPGRMPALPARRREAARRQLEEVVKRSAAKSGRRRAKRVTIAAGAAAIVLATGAAAFAIAEYQPVTNEARARCYTVADVSQRDVATIALAGKPGTKAEVKHARSSCAALFRQGFLRLGVAGVNLSPSKGRHHVPALVVCTMNDGTAAVFPGGPGTCAKLGLPAATRQDRLGRPRPGAAVPIP